ncbi:MAG: phospholipid carrier-dependent glycosyltransferase [Clostridiales bacterium]|nr:phospholipid carrier-dependent glycosyltransferase [Clostridiales bacterium]
MKKLLDKAQHFLFLALFGFIFVVVFIGTPITISGITSRPVNNSVPKLTPIPLPLAILLSLLIYAISVLVLWLLYKGYDKFLRNRQKISQKRVNLIFIISLLILFIGQLIVIFGFDYVAVTDSHVVDVCARNFARDGNMANLYRGLPEKRLQYFATYPNNWGILLIVSYIFRGIHLVLGYVPKEAPAVIAAISVQISVVFTYLSARRIFQNKIQPIFCLFLTLLTPVFAMYSTVLYTDTLSMPFTMASFYLFIRAVQSKKFSKFILWLIPSSIVMAIGYTVKGSVLVMLVAFAIYAFLRLGWKQLISMVLIGALSVVSVNFCLEKAILSLEVTTKENLELEEFPKEHWMMMALYGQGGFYGEDYKFTHSIEGYEAKKEANIRVIKERLSDFGVSGFIVHEIKKINYTWNDGRYFSYNHYRDSSSTNGLVHFFQRNFAFIAFTQIVHIITLALMFLSCLGGFQKKRVTKMALVRLIVFGIALFLLIWETRSRYLINYIPLMIIMAADGMNHLWGLVQKSKDKKQRAKEVEKLKEPVVLENQS